MNDYKELIAHVQGDAAFRHIISECGADGRVWFDKRFICDYVSHLKYAIEQLVKERDAVPVVHGHWIIHVDELFPADSTQECSVCHGEEWLGIKHENYCPNCGAKMDEDVRSNEYGRI